MRKKRIVVLGGGIAGLEFLSRVTRKIDHSKYQLCLIDKNELHIWKPMLHTFAAGSNAPSEQGIPFLIQAKRYNFVFEPGEVSELNIKNKKITLAAYVDKYGKKILPERHVNFDYLVVALGSQTNDFNTKGVKDYAYTIDDLGKALRFYDDLKNYIIQAAILEEKHYLVVVGAGATGVELSGEIINELKQSAQYSDHDFAKNIDLTVVQSGDRVLPSFKQEISQAVKETMNGIGIRTLLSQRVAEVTKDSVVLESGEVLPADQVVWTTGVKAPNVLQQLAGVEQSKISQLVVNNKFQLLDNADIFAIGDCSQMQNKPLPPTAQVASQQAIYLSEYFGDIIDGRPNIPPFEYRDYGALVSVGRYASFGTFGNRMAVKGLIAQLAHLYLYRRHQMQILGIWRGLSAIIADFFRKKAR
ncbi:NAD(P)/FAD-dependent oxidoreductase [Commensalibacter oyaizuii]|uniref:NAD(P)/FAD-dependent oxidoreductase n=1 Tax=Commensalibacter oyaizuii TaxID=3043873 RepID=A0ABT6Q3V2_9PROT|nr:NAD(P)/FAD-dependent oxidoreductase [Commensalibacter sp. TBRC 16381]MDI2091798.1 NAD(P)/FAD-dependent oxidoreductase [Commensalibacter sp. TBRC 16381]